MPNTVMKIFGTLWPRWPTMAGWVSAAWMISPARVFFRSRKRATSMVIDTASMKTR